MSFFKQSLSFFFSALFLFSCGPSADFDETSTDTQTDSVTTVETDQTSSTGSECKKISSAEWTTLIGQQSEAIKNSPEWYASLEDHMKQEDHFCFGKTKEECLLINAEYQLVEVENYCKPKNAKAPCKQTTKEEWATLLVAAIEEVKSNADWFKSIDEHMQNPQHPCSGKSKEECLKINGEYLLTDGKNYCKPEEAKAPCTPTDKTKWASLMTEAKQTIKDNADWYKSLDEHMQDPDHPCSGKNKEECLAINAEYMLVELKNYCKPE